MIPHCSLNILSAIDCFLVFIAPVPTSMLLFSSVHFHEMNFKTPCVLCLSVDEFDFKTAIHVHWVFGVRIVVNQKQDGVESFHNDILT